MTDNTRYIPKDIDKEMKGSFLNYSMSVIVSRALPDVRDGLKPVHRRILYAMYENGLDASHGYQKSAQTVGEVLGYYHPHGDASVYDAMVRLAQDFSLRYPLVDGQGNFGSVDGDPPAAYRYTEARMRRIADEMLRDIEKDTVDFVPNFDNNRTEPSVLPSRIPNLLVNGSTGIAVGMATNIPPHNLSEVCDGLCYLIDNPEADNFRLMEYIPGPDFPTGGIIMGRSGIRSAYVTGRGRITLRGRAEIEEREGGRYRIVITEIPYMVNKSKMLERIADLVKEKRIEGISDLNDESDREGMRVVVDLKREANPQVVLNNLYNLTDLQTTVGVIMLALDGGVPRIMDLKTLLTRYIDFQCDVLVRRTKFDLEKALERQHLLRGLKIACDNIDRVIKIIRESYNDAKERLMAAFGLSEVQANAILNMQLRRLQGLEIEKINRELVEIGERIEYYNRFLSDHTMVLSRLKEDLTRIKEKYGDARRTEIASVSGEVDVEDLIPDEECVFTYTAFGYIKRMPKGIYRSQGRGGRGVSGLARRDEDYVTEIFLARTHSYIMFSTDKGRVYRLKGYEIPRASRRGRGVNIVNLLRLGEGEKVTAVIPASGLSGNLVMVTKKGIIKRTSVENFRNVRKNGLMAITLDPGDDLAWTAVTSGEDDILLATEQGMAIRFPETDVRVMGRTARGVKAMKLSPGDRVVGMGIVSPEKTLLTVTDSGKGRRTDPRLYRSQSRGGRGVISYRPKDGEKVAGIAMVSEDEDIILISREGIIIRTPAGGISLQSRYGGGVRVMRLSEGDKVVTFAPTLSDRRVENSPELPKTQAEREEDDSDLESLIMEELSGAGEEEEE